MDDRVWGWGWWDEMLFHWMEDNGGQHRSPTYDPTTLELLRLRILRLRASRGIPGMLPPLLHPYVYFFLWDSLTLHLFFLDIASQDHNQSQSQLPSRLEYTYIFKHGSINPHFYILSTSYSIPASSCPRTTEFFGNRGM